MNIEQKKILTQQAADLLCVGCKRFYGSEATANMCSQCFKKHQTIAATPKKVHDPRKIPESAELIKDEIVVPEPKKEVNKDKCSTCSRKLKLMGIECKCGLFFCSKHRLPEEHKCTFDHRSAAKARLEKEVVKVEKGKIEEI